MCCSGCTASLRPATGPASAQCSTPRYATNAHCRRALQKTRQSMLDARLCNSWCLAAGGPHSYTLWKSCSSKRSRVLQRDKLCALAFYNTGLAHQHARQPRRRAALRAAQQLALAHRARIHHVAQHQVRRKVLIQRAPPQSARGHADAALSAVHILY